LEPVTGLESGFDSLVLHQQAASLFVIYGGSAGHAGLLGLKLMTLGQRGIVDSSSGAIIGFCGLSQICSLTMDRHNIA
jgi:hypothetical protein